MPWPWDLLYGVGCILLGFAAAIALGYAVIIRRRRRAPWTRAPRQAWEHEDVQQ